MSRLKDLEKIPVKVLQHFRETHESKGISHDLQRYILHLDKAIELFKFEGNITRAANELREEFPDDNLTYLQARKRVGDAINYFNLSNKVKNAAWDQYYADKFENLAKIAIASDNLTEARRNYEKAHHFRTIRNEDGEEGGEKQIVHVLSPDISLLKMIGTEFNLKKLWTDVSEFVDNIPVNEKERERLKNEAAENLQYEDVDYEELNDD